MIANKKEGYIFMLKKMKYVPPYLIRNLFPTFQWKSRTNKVLLTFDDGPLTDNTNLILKKLEQYNIKALFFCVGDNVFRYPAVVKEILSAGHTIGNHTAHHKKVTDKDFNPGVEIEEFNKAFFNAFGFWMKYFRPPHGKFNLYTGRLLKEYDLTNIMWTLLTYDFLNNLDEVKYAVSNHLRSDSIVVFHDSLKSKDIISDSIDYLVEQAAKKNYSIGTPEECLK